MGIADQTELHLQLQNPNISTMFALFFMLFTTIIAPLIPTLSSQSPPCPPFPSLTTPPPAPAFQFPPIPPFRPFTSSRPPPKPLLPPSQPRPVSVPLVLGSILALTTLTTILTVVIYNRQPNQHQTGPVIQIPAILQPVPEKPNSPPCLELCKCAHDPPTRVEPYRCVLDHILIYDY